MAGAGFHSFAKLFAKMCYADLGNLRFELCGFQKKNVHTAEKPAVKI
jgi:hypothetical protein